MIRFKKAMLAEGVTGLVLVVSATPFFWVAVPFGGYLRFDVWYFVLAAFFVVTLPPRSRKKLE